MEIERSSYCLLFFALMIAAQRRYSLQEVMRVLPVSAPVRHLAGALAT